MLNFFFSSLAVNHSSWVVYIACGAASIVLGAAIAFVHMYKNNFTRSFVITLATLPLIVQTVIFVVNGQVGAGIAVAGAFSLVRFRSAPGTAREIASIFLAMALGLANGMGYLGISVIMTSVTLLITVLYTVLNFGGTKAAEKQLKITIPENLDYTELFDEVFAKYTAFNSLERVKTTNMGSLYQLYFKIVIKDNKLEKQFIDELRCLNGNLDIICGRMPLNDELL